MNPPYWKYVAFSEVMGKGSSRTKSKQPTKDFHSLCSAECRAGEGEGRVIGAHKAEGEVVDYDIASHDTAEQAGKSARPPGKDGFEISDFWRPTLLTCITSVRASSVDSYRQSR